MNYKINLFDKIESRFSVVMAVLIILCYSLFVSTSFVSVAKASQEGITTTKVNAVSTKVIAANSSSKPSSNILSYKVNLSSSKVIPARDIMQLPQSLLLSYTVTNTEGVSSERVLSANTNGSSNSPNYNVVPHIQRTISNATR
jgi:hypothetical protein